MDAPPSWLLTFAKDLTVTLLLLYFIVAINRGWWISGREFTALDERCKKLEATAATQEKALQEAVHALHQVVGAIQSRPV